MTAKSTKALGPYNRYAIWTQGCFRHCSGCISKDSWPLDGGYEISTPDLANDIINTPGIEGMTISGGEPYLQEEALVDLIKRVKSRRDAGIIIYTGFVFEEIKQKELTQICDLIIDGAYVEELNDDLSLRGSSNQRLSFITGRYKEEAKILYGVSGRKVELRFDNDKTMLIGVPDKNSLKMLGGNRKN